MHCLIFILLCCGVDFSFSQVDIKAAVKEEIKKQISPLQAKYAEVETVNLKNQKTITDLQKQILELKKDNVLKSSEIFIANQRLQQLASIPRGEPLLSEDICHYVSKQCPTNSRQGRQIGQNVAFSAYMEHKGGNNHIGNKLLYNQVLGNYGNGYNTSNGIFTAPSTGLYAFLWVTQVHHDSWCSTRMLRNGYIMSVTSSNAKATGSGANESGSGTGFLITYMNRGDTAFIEMNNPSGQTCSIVSNDKGLSTFSGWEIAIM